MIAIAELENPVLEDCTAKLLRMGKQIAQLNDDLTNYLSTGIHIGFREKVGEGRVEIVIESMEPVPRDLGVRIGEIVHNGRSGLNQLFVRMIELNGARPSKQTDFPIFLERKDFPRLGDKRIAGLSAKQYAELEKLQPFKIPNPTEHLLWALHTLNNQDKHRYTLGGARLSDGITYLVNGDYPINFELPPPKEAYGTGAALYVGKPLGAITNPKFPFNTAQLTVQFGSGLFVFGEENGVATGRPIIESLVGVYRLLRDAVFVSPGCLDGF